MTARFLNEDERLLAVERIKVNQAGVENKHFKRDQYGSHPQIRTGQAELICPISRFIETMRDPKTYFLFFFAASSNVVNSVSLPTVGIAMVLAHIPACAI